MLYKVQKVQKYALNSQLQALQILANDDEVENLSLSSFLLAVQGIWPAQPSINQIFMSCHVLFFIFQCQVRIAGTSSYQSTCYQSS